MRLKVYPAIAACCIIFSGLAHAASLNLGVEPYLGYSEFSYTAGSPGGGPSVSDSKMGPVLGGKGGVLVGERFWVALDYHLGGPYNLENNKHEYLNRMWGAGAGLIKKGKVRAWLGYYFSNELDDTDRNIIYEGKGFKASVGVEFQSRLAINLEYCKEEFDKVRAQGQTTSAPASLDVSLIFISLSSPLTLN